MKKFQWISYLALVLGVPAMAQDFPGYRAGNFTGVNGVFFNPANIADSRYRFDFNLLSLNLSVGNTAAAFKLKDIKNSFNEDDLKTQLFSDQAGPASGLLSVNVVGPSFMFNAGKKTSFALTSRARVMLNIHDIDGKLANKLVKDMEEEDSDFPYTISSDKNMMVSANGWKEFGVSMGRVLTNGGKHFVKGGVTLKYLSGVANAHLYINKLQATMDEDAAEDYYLTNASGALGLGFGGSSILGGDFKLKDLLSFNSTGFGGDIGFVYEYRPDPSVQSKDANKYKFRLGVALLDLGSLKYKRDMDRSAAYNIDISSSEKFYLKELDDEKLDNYKEVLDNYPQYFTPSNANTEANMKVTLPTSLHVDVDYRIHRGFYLNAAGQFSLSKMDNKPQRNEYYNSFTATPRFEGRVFGLYLPVNYNELTEFNAGVSLRIGSLFIGSGSILTAILNDSKQADFHLGLHFGSLQAKTKTPKKKKSVDTGNE